MKTHSPLEVEVEAGIDGIWIRCCAHETRRGDQGQETRVSWEGPRGSRTADSALSTATSSTATFRHFIRGTGFPLCLLSGAKTGCGRLHSARELIGPIPLRRGHNRRATKTLAVVVR